MKKILGALVIIGVVILLHAQATCRVVTYDDAFTGKETASGDIFSQEKLTAAHESLPLGTEVELFYVQSGKKVRVTVNDRLENAPDMFWISKTAADSLGIRSVYPTEVLYTVPGEDPVPEDHSLYSELFTSLSPNLEKRENDPFLPLERDSKSARAGTGVYAVQIYACNKRSDALLLSRRLQNHFDYLSYIEKTYVEGETRYRLIIGDFEEYADAAECVRKLQVHIPDIFIVRAR
jgi:rare lipoprotein A